MVALVVVAAAVEVPVASPAAAGGAVAAEDSAGQEAAAASPAAAVAAASPVVAAAVVAGSAARGASPGVGGVAAVVAGGAGKAVLHVFEQMIWGERGAFRAVLEQLLPKTVPAFSAVTAKITELSGKLDRRLEGFGIFFLLYSCFEGDWCTCRDVEKISLFGSLESH